LGVSNDAMSLCTGSWDSTVRLLIAIGFISFYETNPSFATAQGLGMVVYIAELVAARCWNSRVKPFAAPSIAHQSIYLVFGKHQAVLISESVRKLYQ
jgi:hypothetical protein